MMLRLCRRSRRRRVLGGVATRSSGARLPSQLPVSHLRRQYRLCRTWPDLQIFRLTTRPVYRCGSDKRNWNKFWMCAFADTLKVDVSSFTKPSADLFLRMAVGEPWREAITNRMHGLP